MEALLVWHSCWRFIEHKILKYVFIQMDLNLQQIRWLELLKDYDMSVFYHTSKDYVVADALNQMTMGSVSHIDEIKKERCS